MFLLISRSEHILYLFFFFDLKLESVCSEKVTFTKIPFGFPTGLQHQGIFRVSGSQVEVNDIKNSFERGERASKGLQRGHMVYSFCWVKLGLMVSVCGPGNDPLIDEESNHDINSVAGVLKLYFRGLDNPLFPKDRFNDLISCVRKCC